jgi:uncharacterized protein
MYALVTGATSGIGKEIALLLAQKQINLILAARRVPELQALKTQWENEYKIQVQILPTDLSDRAQVQKLHAFCVPFDPEIVVNNAGFGIVDLFLDIPLENEIAMIETNIVALHTLTKLFARSMTKGKILNVASMAGFLPTPRMASYAATKAYVYHFSEAVNYELKKTKPSLKVLSLCPGPVETEFAEVAGVKMGLKGISAKKCAKDAVNGLMKGRHLTIPDGRMRLTKFFLRFLPTTWVLPISYNLQSKK